MAQLINLHPLWHWPPRGHFSHSPLLLHFRCIRCIRCARLVSRHFLLFGFHLAICDIWLEALVVVGSAHDRVDDGHENGNDGQDGEGGQLFSGWQVGVPMTGGIHSHELEEEVGETAEVKNLSSGQAECRRWGWCGDLQ